MVKKKFIDKKNATTYNLVFRSTEDVDDVPERVLIDADKRLGVGRVDTSAAAAAHDAAAAAGRRYPPGHPLAWLEEEAQQAPLGEGRRRELIELGFPDDGYDYLKHMRVLGRGVAGMEGGSRAAEPVVVPDAEAAPAAAPGPSVYMPAPQLEAPEEDRKLIDASGLTVMQAVEEEGDAAVMAGGVTAFSKEKPRVHGLGKRELDELEAAMLELEEAESVGDADGFGDLLDDFVLAATEYTPAADGETDGQQAQQGAADAWSEDEDEYSEVESYEEEGSSYGGSEGAGPDGSAAGRSGKAPARPGSIASTYWREERHDRKNLLTVIDEKFEHLALEYDEEEIGDLEEQGHEIRGFADVAEFDNLLDEFLEVHGESKAGHEGNVPYPFRKPSQVGQEMEFHGFDDADAAVAVEKAREAVRQAEAEELNAEESGAASRREERVPTYLQPQERERWDCESILSLRSNLDNHPGRISEPRTARRPRAASSAAGAGAAAQGLIRLDPRSGIPLGVLPRRGAGGLPEAAAGAQGGEAEAEEEEAEAAAAAALPLERRKGESAEEKKARKAAVKGAKRAAREQKKELKSMFKEASVAAQRRAATAQPQAALHLPS
ncbi:LTV1-like protein [Chlorella sorokiniana]|uniref:LTV1-like protein n=1 Tax=Chlorella sorokiniana TaxID=3076 RepID=A0A2P6TRU2_CHLSO|nr:LTV1-like protein [Chlorella sorokiniana]|eukprot:PRW56768.1 LTV1-like protein [Chlorella sorokiniana]